MVQQMAVLSVHLCRSNSYPLRPRCITWIKTKREGVKSERSGAPKPDKLGLSCKANKCSDAETGGLGALSTHYTPLIKLATLRSTHGTTESPRSDGLIPLRSSCSRYLPGLLQDKFQASKLDHSCARCQSSRSETIQLK